MGQGKRGKEVKSNITDNESCKVTTSKGTIQGYNGIATVDKKHQIIVDAQVFGEGQEHHTLKPVIERTEARFQRMGIHPNIASSGAIFTADTGFANEDNMEYLHENGINGYVPDNHFRSRDPRFADQKTNHGKRHQQNKKPSKRTQIPSSEFELNPVTKTCQCRAGQAMWLKKEGEDKHGNYKLFYEGRISKCRTCELKTRCMKNPESANSRKGNGRQVSFILSSNKKVTYTDWMKRRIDSEKGKLIYSHRMSVVEPVFGNMTYNKGLNRFSLRGRKKVQGQWCLYCLVHNIEKIANYGAQIH